MTTALWRVATADGPRLARGTVEAGPAELLEDELTLARLLADDGPGLADLTVLPAMGPVTGPAPATARPLAPVDAQPIWAAGVTFQRSREARKEESHGLDFYDHVYDAVRPEIFLKALPGTARGPGQDIGVRRDSTWDVPEPELGVVADASGRAVGYVLGDDVSSRSIEGENPLYLPQAKIYDGSCAIGPCVVPLAEAPPLAEMRISLIVRRAGVTEFEDTVHLARMRRTVDDLLDWLFAACSFPDGGVLLTGTSIVPPEDFTLSDGDEVEIAATGLGSLINGVRLVGAPAGKGAAS
ncbi:MAG: hypothetical protein GEV03_00410 [Streptosporangiales bacterium]|nr:hypothetical protein [Streptosporangiales bacterium]